MTVKVSVIIPVFNAELTLERCLQALSKQTFTAFELLIVDNGSTDGSHAIVEQWAKYSSVQIQVIDEKRQGAAAARNAGVAASQGQWLAFTDADCEPNKDWLQIGLDLITAHSPRAMAGPAWGTIEGDLSAKLQGLTTLSVGLDEHWREDASETGVNGFATANFWLERRLFDTLHGFDEGLSVSGEDYDLCARIYEQRVNIFYSPVLCVVHNHLNGFKLMLTKAASYGRAHGYLFEKYGKDGIYMDLFGGKKLKLPAPMKIWVNLVSADKKLAVLLMLSLLFPLCWLLLILYPVMMARHLFKRAAAQEKPLGFFEAYIMGWVMIMRSVAFTVGRVQSSRLKVWLA
ncbi:MAG: glycosyltransferase family A protein [Ghiorsea sp.]